MDVKYFSTANNTVINTILPRVSCLLIDFATTNGIDCETYPNESDSDNDSATTVCIRCDITGQFLFPESLDEESGPSHIICIFIWLLIFVLGSLSTLSNLFIIFIMFCKKQSKAFNTFLLVLGVFDLLCSVLTVITSTAAIVYFQNWDRGFLTLNLYQLGTNLALFGRSGSALMTALMAFERCIVVKYPLKIYWFGKLRTRCLVSLVTLYAILMSVDRFLSFRVGVNGIETSVNSTKNLEWLILGTNQRGSWNQDLHDIIDVLDYAVPGIPLLVCNIILYYEILKINRTRKDIKTSERKQVDATKVIFPVVFFLAVCNIVPIIHFAIMRIGGVMIRDLNLLFLLSLCVNASVNLPIYYFRSKSFRNDAKNAFKNFTPSKWISKSRSTTSPTTKTSSVTSTKK